MAKGKTIEKGLIKPVALQQGRAEFCILGKTPLIYNSVSFHARGELLLPRGRLNAAEKATSLKHVPLEEYRESIYRFRDEQVDQTVLALPCRMFKAAIAMVAKRIPGATTAEIKQLVWVEQDMVPLYGVPQLYMALVRNSDINRTPDIRTRAIVPQWGCRITLQYAMPQLNFESVATLLANAGILNGVGDYRQEKGAGSYGQFELVKPDNPQFRAVQKLGAKQQLPALKEPDCYDQDTEELLEWYTQEVSKRDMPVSNRRSRRVDKNGGDDSLAH